MRSEEDIRIRRDQVMHTVVFLNERKETTLRKEAEMELDALNWVLFEKED